MERREALRKEGAGPCPRWRKAGRIIACIDPDISSQIIKEERKNKAGEEQVWEKVCEEGLGSQLNEKACHAD